MSAFNKYVLFVSCIFAFHIHSSLAETEMSVIADRVNLRANASDQAEVVFQVSKDTVLKTGEKKDDWLQVQPPTGAYVWVHSDFVKNGKIAANNTRLRAQPGINHSIVGKLNEGTSVTVEGQHMQWLKIIPPQGCYFWINESYVLPLSSTNTPNISTNVTKSGAPSSVKLPEALQSVTKLPEGIERESLSNTNTQGRTSSFSGTLKSSMFSLFQPSKYKLVQDDRQGRSETLCYIIGNKTQLESVDGKTMMVSGKEYWYKDESYPIIKAEKIILKE